MSWTIEYEDAYERWVSRTDFDAGENTRPAALQLMADWKLHGPPTEIDYDSALGAWSCTLPGTAVDVEYIVWREASAVFVVDFHSSI